LDRIKICFTFATSFEQQGKAKKEREQKNENFFAGNKKRIIFAVPKEIREKVL